MSSSRLELLEIEYNNLYQQELEICREFDSKLIIIKNLINEEEKRIKKELKKELKKNKKNIDISSNECTWNIPDDEIGIKPINI